MRRLHWSLWGSLIFFSISFCFLLIPSWRAQVQNLNRGQGQILSVAAADLYPNSPFKKVVKISTAEGIALRIFTNEDGIEVLMTQIDLGDPFDAFYEINTRPTNLALNDINGDGVPEIIAPTYSFQWLPKLNIFRFNKENQSFEPY